MAGAELAIVFSEILDHVIYARTAGVMVTFGSGFVSSHWSSLPGSSSFAFGHSKVRSYWRLTLSGRTCFVTCVFDMLMCLRYRQ
jgi:hypothetical protein